MEITMNNKKEIKEFKQLNLNDNNDITDQFIDCEIIRLKNEIIQNHIHSVLYLFQASFHFLTHHLTSPLIY